MESKKPDYMPLINALKKKSSPEDLTKKYQFLIYGSSGSGKTFSLRTARKPLLVDSFDPGGSVALKPLVESGEAIVISEYEKEDPQKPTAFKRWDDNFDRLLKADVFSHVGTYVLDSLTTWSSAILSHVLLKSGRPGGVPQQNDWYPQMTYMENAFHVILSLPCDVIVIAHDDYLKDDITGKIVRAPLITGKARKRIPLMFSEVFYSTTNRTSKGEDYVWQIRKDSTNDARSRLSGLAGKTDMTVQQDFKAFMKLLNLPYDDLPPFKGGEYAD